MDDSEMKMFFQLILVMALLLAMLGCGEEQPNERVLFDFESDADLDRIHWKCHTLFSLTSEHAIHGKTCLKMELFPSVYPGFAPTLKAYDFRGYESLRFDVYNPGEEVQLIVRIDDKEDSHDYADRYNKGYSIKPELNQIEIPLAELKTSGTERSLGLGHIRRFLLFLVNPASKVTLYLDYVRLERGV